MAHVDEPTPSLSLLVQSIALAGHIHENEAAFVAKGVPLQCSHGGLSVANSGFSGRVEHVQQQK